MNSINRFSSRRQRLDHAFLRDRLKSAKSYKRIAGYFRSSIFELVGEEIGLIETVQIICNSELDAADVVVSKHAREMALKERWNGVALIFVIVPYLAGKRCTSFDRTSSTHQPDLELPLIGSSTSTSSTSGCELSSTLSIPVNLFQI
jgi:hypothetical protein